MFLQRNREWLIKSVIVYLVDAYYLDNCSNSRANTCKKPQLFGEGVALSTSTLLRVHALVYLNGDNCPNRENRKAAIDQPSFCPINLMVVYWTTMVITGNGELGFDSGEGA